MLSDVFAVTADDLGTVAGMMVYPASIFNVDGRLFFLGQRGGEKLLGVAAGEEGANLDGFGGTEGEVVLGGRSARLRLCPLTAANAAALRDCLPWLRPRPLDIQTSAGFGDRLGVATPGHAQAARGFSDLPKIGAIRPIFAQQSVRENARTGRTPQQVLDEAAWGLFQKGWQGPWGADADHLKTPADADPFIAAGYTLYTVDPGDHVDDVAHTAPRAEVEAKVEALPWEALQDTAADLERRYLDRSFDLGEVALVFSREALWRAAAKYGRAVAHTAAMYRHLVGKMRGGAFELEVSVDETATPTSPLEHYYVAGELQRLGVMWVSLAPRYVGRFEKGVDYIGDLPEFEDELAKHAAIAFALGPYKLSIHSGSDKFRIYPIVGRLTRGLVHLKTAGTSYLEALRAVAQVDPPFFREILALARQRYEADRVTYHVSAQLDRVPGPYEMEAIDLPDLLNRFDARQVLHVTFGSVLDRFGPRLREVLLAHEDVYYALLEGHFRRHLAALVKGE